MEWSYKRGITVLKKTRTRDYDNDATEFKGCIIHKKVCSVETSCEYKMFYLISLRDLNFIYLKKNQYIYSVKIVWRYQRGNQKLYIEEGQTLQWPKRKSTNNDLQNILNVFYHNCVFPIPGAPQNSVILQSGTPPPNTASICCENVIIAESVCSCCKMS